MITNDNVQLNFNSDGELESLENISINIMLMEYKKLLFNSQLNHQKTFQLNTATSRQELQEELRELGFEHRLAGGNEFIAYKRSASKEHLDCMICYFLPKHEGVKRIHGLVCADNLEDMDICQNLFQKQKIDIIDKKCHIDWTYKTYRGLETTTFFENLDDSFHYEAYPSRPNLKEQIQSFLESDNTVLILMGEAGTGKTQLLREIVRQLKRTEIPRLLYSSDQEALSSDEIFIQFRECQYDLLILEDIDFNLRARSESNTIMPRFLNASDGFIKGANRAKIIFTTNIININKIDPALLRAGRCFGVWNFPKLSKQEAIALGQKLSIPDREFTKDQYTLAEIYRLAKPEKKHTLSVERSSIGFHHENRFHRRRCSPAIPF